MKEKDVVEFYSYMTAIGICMWIDGGWGVDALIGNQTRIHNDLDITIQKKDLYGFRKEMESREYKRTNLSIERPHNFVLTDSFNRLIDVHIIEINEQGDGIYGPPENGNIYPAASLTGRGIIGKLQVNCISPEYVVMFHTGYTLKEKDYNDIVAICKKFNFKIPREYIKDRDNRVF